MYLGTVLRTFGSAAEEDDRRVGRYGFDTAICVDRIGGQFLLWWCMMMIIVIVTVTGHCTIV